MPYRGTRDGVGRIPIPDINDPDVTPLDVAKAIQQQLALYGQNVSVPSILAAMAYEEGVQTEGGTSDYGRFGLGGIPDFIKTDITRMISTKLERQATITQTARRYVDVPTPEEFLNDFEVGFQGMMNQMVEQGQLSPRDMGLVQDLMPEIFNEYIAELGQRAARGEDIFTVVGLPAEERRIGARAGEVTETREKGKQREDTTVKETTAAQAAGGELGAAPRTEETVKQTEETQFDQTEKFRQTEEIYRRNKLAVVHELSPMEFIMQRFKSPEALQTYVQAKKGEKTRRAQTTLGVPVSTPRRV